MADITAPLVPAVDRVLNILEYLSRKREFISTKELADQLDIPPTSAFRLVKQLLSRGYLEEDPQHTGFFRLGLQILTLSNSLPQVSALRDLARLELEHLAVESRQAVQLGVLKGSEIIYIEQILPPNPIVIYTSPYSVLPLNVSAAGKILVAYAPKQVAATLLADVTFDKRTDHTIDTVEQFIAHLDEVRRLGYAVDDEEFALGIGCIAAPIFDHERRCVAAVGLTGSIYDYHDVARERLSKLLIDSAKKISQRLGMQEQEDT